MLNWIRNLFGMSDPAPQSPPRHSPAQRPQPRPGADQSRDDSALAPDTSGHHRHRHVREDTGTHETLKIVDDEIEVEEDDGGFDPYNTGRYDRTRNWDKRLR